MPMTHLLHYLQSLPLRLNAFVDLLIPSQWCTLVLFSSNDQGRNSDAGIVGDFGISDHFAYRLVSLGVLREEQLTYERLLQRRST